MNKRTFTMARTLVCALLVPVGVTLTNGCSKGPALATVKGTVTVDGTPLAKGSIVFEMDGARPATGRIENGQIVELTTHKTGDGAAIGTHKVAIFANEEPPQTSEGANPGDAKAPPANYMSGKSLIPAHYSDPGTSGLTAEIKKGENVLEFKLSSQKP